MATWNDSQLGEFTFDYFQWEQTLRMEAFSVFTYFESEARKVASSNASVAICIEAEDESDFPSEEIVAIARLTIKNHARLLRDGLHALLNDMLGNGPDSGMWWHSNIDQVIEIIEGQAKGPALTKLNHPDDLYSLLGKPSIRIQEFGYGYDRPCSVISFESAFEPEHGIGVLTDGSKVLGVGYEMDVSPFDS